MTDQPLESNEQELAELIEAELDRFMEQKSLGRYIAWVNVGHRKDVAVTAAQVAAEWCEKRYKDSYVDCSLHERDRARIEELTTALEEIRRISLARPEFLAVAEMSTIAKNVLSKDSPSTTNEQCSHTFMNGQCELEAGHDGKHRAGGILWAELPTEQRGVRATDGVQSPSTTIESGE